jgi:hypothetical protein
VLLLALSPWFAAVELLLFVGWRKARFSPGVAWNVPSPSLLSPASPQSPPDASSSPAAAAVLQGRPGPGRRPARTTSITPLRRKAAMQQGASQARWQWRTAVQAAIVAPLAYIDLRINRRQLLPPLPYYSLKALHHLALAVLLVAGPHLADTLQSGRLAPLAFLLPVLSSLPPATSAARDAAMVLTLALALASMLLPVVYTAIWRPAPYAVRLRGATPPVAVGWKCDDD